MLSKQELDQLLPIKISALEDIIDRIHIQYPLVSKVDIVIVVKSFFECIRYLLYINDTVSINNFIGRMKLNKFYRSHINKILTCYSVRISTPRIYKNAKL
jgi:nucleoid DNA-binding protein